jgi:hypothetical protein
MQLLTALGLFLAGILAGMELVVRYGIHPALMRLSDRAHLEARHEVVGIVRVRCSWSRRSCRADGRRA